MKLVSRYDLICMLIFPSGLHHTAQQKKHLYEKMNKPVLDPAPPLWCQFVMETDKLMVGDSRIIYLDPRRGS